jgi:hypothetical protein
VLKTILNCGQGFGRVIALSNHARDLMAHLYSIENKDDIQQENKVKT